MARFDVTPAEATVDRLVYYVPRVPDVHTTGRYVHASLLPQFAECAELITHEAPPEPVADRYDEIHILEPGLVNRVRSAARVADAANETVFVTTFHYEPVLAGLWADSFWVTDVYDDPGQYALNHPRSHHAISGRLLRRLVGRADRTSFALFPGEVPLGAHENVVIPTGMGCPTHSFEPTYPDRDGPLRCIWVGSPRLDRGMEPLINALDRTDADLRIDAFGEPYEPAAAAAERHGVDDVLTFHGVVDHDRARREICESHVGLCVLPERPDWKYAATLKVREYLAGGTVPLVSDFTGLRMLAKDVGVYVDPEGVALAERLERLAALPDDDLQHHMRAARERAEAVPMRREARWWALQTLGIADEGFALDPNGEFRST